MTPEPATPPCPHFGACGGCTLQHLPDPDYGAFKLGLVQDAVRRLGFTAALPPLERTPPAARRRMDLAIRRNGAAIQLGLHRLRSAEIEDMHACPVLHPTLFALVQALRPVLRSLDGLRRGGSAVVNLLDTGPDLLLRTDAPLSARDRTRLAALATAQGLPRIAWALGERGDVETACQLGPSMLAFDGVATPVPPGAFLQASREGEAAIRAAVLAALPRLKPRAVIIELFAGVGTLTHALTARARVLAYEGDRAAIAALRAAGNHRVTATPRDLVRQPLQPPELRQAAAVVLDPPFAGAAVQMSALAAARVPVVYVSCNPAALARDGASLVRAGYQVAAATGVDQFLWSARIESVVLFSPP